MSHVVQMNIEVHDLDSLERAAQSLGGTLDRNAREFKYFVGNKEKCDAGVIRFPNCEYEIGIRTTGDMTNPGYTLNCDFWSGAIAKATGDGGYKLNQAYGLELARKHYESQGYMLDVQTDAEGTLEITAVRY